MKTRSLVRLLGADVLVFFGIALFSVVFFDSGGFLQRFQSALIVMTTVGYGNSAEVPVLVGWMLAISGLVLGGAFFVILLILLVKVVLAAVRNEHQTN